MQVKPDNNEKIEDLSEISLAKPEYNEKLNNNNNNNKTNNKTDKLEQEMNKNNYISNHTNHDQNDSSITSNGLNHRNKNNKIEQFKVENKMNKAIFTLKTKGIKEQSEYISKTNIYIKGLSENTTDDDLYNMCSKYGEIKSTKSIIDKETSKCKGYGFVDFKEPNNALKAVEAMQKEKMDVQLAKQRIQDPTNIYFANLPLDIDENTIVEMLSKKFEATVISARVMREKNGFSKGVGFARVNDQRICDKIIQELNGNTFPNHQDNSKILVVKLADSWTLTESKNPQSYSDSEELSYYQIPNRFTNSHNIDRYKFFNSYLISNNYMNNKPVYSNYDLDYHKRNGDFYSHYLPPMNGYYHQQPFQIDQFNNVSYSYNSYLMPSFHVVHANQYYNQQANTKRSQEKPPQQSQQQQQQQPPYQTQVDERVKQQKKKP